MRRHPRARATAALLSALFVAQCASGQTGPDPFYWRIENSFLPIPTAQIRLLDGTGATFTTWPIAAGLPNLLFVIGQVAKAANGTVWVSETFSGTLTPYTALGGPGTSISTPGIIASTMDVSGGPWTLEGGNVILRDTLGNPVVTGTHTLSSPTLLVSGPVGSVWLFDSSPVQFQNVSAGGLPGSILGTSGLLLGGAAVDPLNQVWVLTNAGLEVFDSQGNPLVMLQPPGSGNFAHVAVDSIGRIRVLVATLFGGSLITYDPTSLTQTGVLPLPPTPQPYVHASFDHLGRCWLESAGGSATLIDQEGSALTTLGSPGALPPLNPGSPGDPTGVHLLSVLIPSADSDLDSVGNATESALGSDPLDSTSRPAVLATVSPVVAGQTSTFGVASPSEPGFLFATGASLGNGPTVLSPFHPHTMPLTIDALFQLWIGPANPVLTTPLIGTLSNVGTGAVTVFLPPGSSGITFQMAALTIDPATVRVGRLSSALTVQIQ